MAQKIIPAQQEEPVSARCAGAEDEDAEYWLKFVKTFGASPPTIVVLNIIKVQPFQVNRRALHRANGGWRIWRGFSPFQ